MKVKLLSHVRLLATPWTAAYKAPPSMGFSRQEYWSEVPLPSPLSIREAQIRMYQNLDSNPHLHYSETRSPNGGKQKLEFDPLDHSAILTHL